MDLARNISSICSIPENDDYGLTKLLDRPSLNLNREKLFDKRLPNELSICLTIRGLDDFENSHSRGQYGFETPASRNSFEPRGCGSIEVIHKSLSHFCNTLNSKRV